MDFERLMEILWDMRPICTMAEHPRVKFTHRGTGRARVDKNLITVPRCLVRTQNDYYLAYVLIHEYSHFLRFYNYDGGKEYDRHGLKHDAVFHAIEMELLNAFNIAIRYNGDYASELWVDGSQVWDFVDIDKFNHPFRYLMNAENNAYQ